MQSQILERENFYFDEFLTERLFLEKLQAIRICLSAQKEKCKSIRLPDRLTTLLKVWNLFQGRDPHHKKSEVSSTCIASETIPQGRDNQKEVYDFLCRYVFRLPDSGKQGDINLDSISAKLLLQIFSLCEKHVQESCVNDHLLCSIKSDRHLFLLFYNNGLLNKDNLSRILTFAYDENNLECFKDLLKICRPEDALTAWFYIAKELSGNKERNYFFLMRYYQILEWLYFYLVNI